jgi:hypothetical protein
MADPVTLSPPALPSASGATAQRRSAIRARHVPVGSLSSHHPQFALSVRGEVQSFIFSRKGLQNHEKCGFAATRLFENS